MKCATAAGGESESCSYHMSVSSKFTRNNFLWNFVILVNRFGVVNGENGELKFQSIGACAKPNTLGTHSESERARARAKVMLTDSVHTFTVATAASS